MMMFSYSQTFSKDIGTIFQSHISLQHYSCPVQCSYVWYSNEQRNEHFPNLSASEHTVIKSLENQTVKLILRQHFLLDECNFLSENKLEAEPGKHHIGKQKGEQLFTFPTFRTFHRQAIALIHFLDSIYKGNIARGTTDPGY